MREEAISGASAEPCEEGFHLPTGPTAGTDGATLASLSRVIWMVVQEGRWDLGG